MSDEPARLDKLLLAHFLSVFGAVPRHESAVLPPDSLQQLDARHCVNARVGVRDPRSAMAPLPASLAVEISSRAHGGKTAKALLVFGDWDVGREAQCLSRLLTPHHAGGRGHVIRYHFAQINAADM